jgi:hypothetical protein
MGRFPTDPLLLFSVQPQLLLDLLFAPALAQVAVGFPAHLFPFV